jgi:hypothetical protein
MQCNAVNAKNASKQHQMTEQASKQASLQFSHSTPLSKCVFCFAPCVQNRLFQGTVHTEQKKKHHIACVCVFVFQSANVLSPSIKTSKCARID